MFFRKKQTKIIKFLLINSPNYQMCCGVAHIFSMLFYFPRNQNKIEEIVVKIKIKIHKKQAMNYAKNKWKIL